MKPNAVLGEWYDRVCVTQIGHYASAQHYSRLHYWLGIPVMVLSTVVGTSVFATLQQQQLDPILRITVGLLSVVAAVLASLQTFLGFSERAERHRVAGAKYGAVGRELQACLASTQDEVDPCTAQIRERLDALAQESPNVPPAIYRRSEMESAEPRKRAKPSNLLLLPTSSAGGPS
jgi:hypothetical protein